MTPRYPEIIAGEQIAAKLKNHFFADVPWSPKVAFQVAEKMSQLKKITRRYYSDFDDVQFLHKLGAYSPQDIDDAFESGKEALCKNESQGNIGGIVKTSMQ